MLLYDKCDDNTAFGYNPVPLTSNEFAIKATAVLPNSATVLFSVGA